MTDKPYLRTPHADSLALQTLAYRALGHVGMQEDAPLDPIPAFLLKPTHGECIHCNQDCDEQDEDGLWIHEGCHAELVADTERDQRLDDPRRGQGDR